MNKKKKTEAPPREPKVKKLNPEAAAYYDPPKSWKEYGKEHLRKIKELHRELTGDNMNHPPEKDYD